VCSCTFIRVTGPDKPVATSINKTSGETCLVKCGRNLQHDVLNAKVVSDDDDDGKVKVKLSRYCHTGVKRETRYSYSFLTWALD
jgi:hypothetical protein